jgi:hypothetical protein
MPSLRIRGIVNGILLILIILCGTLYVQIAGTRNSSLSYPQERYRPLIGGIQVEIREPPYYWPTSFCTISFPARNTTSNQVGVVVPYRCANFRQDYQSVSASQPYYPEGVGMVSYANSTIDLMFIPTSVSVEPAVLHIENNTKYILRIVSYPN